MDTRDLEERLDRCRTLIRKCEDCLYSTGKVVALSSAIMEIACYLDMKPKADYLQIVSLEMYEDLMRDLSNTNKNK